MLKGSRLLVIAIGGLIVLFGTASADIVFEEVINGAADHDHSAHHSQQSGGYYQWECPPPFLCVNAIIGSPPTYKESTENNSETERDSYDHESIELQRFGLTVKEPGVNWTKWIFFTAFAQAIVTTIGIFFVWRTLAATREAVEEAGKATEAANAAVVATREIGEAQTRCYPSITSIYAIIGFGRKVKRIFSDSFPDEVYGKKQIFVEIYFDVKNFGRSPMYDFAWRPAIKYRFITKENKGEYMESDKRVPTLDESRVTPPDIDFSESGILDFPIDPVVVEALRETTDWSGIEFFVVLSVHYRDVFGQVFDEDWTYFGLGHGSDINSRLKIDLQSIPYTVFKGGFESEAITEHQVHNED